jgi:molybdenum cofactor cytidylyltransferase
VKFGPVPVADALGAVLAHGVRIDSGTLKKGTVLDAAALAALSEAGVETVVCAVLDADDVGEDEAAARIARALAGPGVCVDAAATGRVNLFAETDGLFVLDAAAVGRLNAVDEAITLATLRPDARVAAGQMTATVKIIPYAVPAEAVKRAEDAAAPAAVSVAPFRPLRTALIVTRAAGDKPSVVDKRRAAVTARVEALGGSVAVERTVDHNTAAVAAALAAVGATDLVLVFGAAAIADRADVIPAALEAAGGTVERLGMPVDPGNLALIGTLNGRPAVGVPSCAASPKANGFDWILERLFAGCAVSSAAVAAMGVGGLLAEIPTRPRPRRAAAKAGHGRVAALVLAAGRSSRMGARFKLIEPVGGTPIVRRVAEAACACAADDVIVVTGHRADAVEAAVAGTRARTVRNPAFADGLSASLRAGLAALAPGTEAVVVFLGDMPLVGAAVADALIAAHRAGDRRRPCVPVTDGRRGNPVLWPAAFFETLAALDGDSGARSVLAENADWVVEVPVDSESILIDVDTAEALDALRGAPDSA